MADAAHMFNIRTLISLQQLKLETSNLVCASTTMSNFDARQKPGKSLGDLSLNLRAPVNISRTAKAIFSKFGMQIGCKE